MPKVVKESYPDKVIRLDMAIGGKQVTIQYLGDMSKMISKPKLENGEVYSKNHTHAIIVDHEYKCFI